MSVRLVSIDFPFMQISKLYVSVNFDLWKSPSVFFFFSLFGVYIHFNNFKNATSNIWFFVFTIRNVTSEQLKGRMGSWENSKHGKLRKLETWEEKWLIARHKNLIPKIDTKNSRAVVVFQIFLEVFENIS